MNANVPMLDEVAGKNTKEVIDALNETIRQQQEEIQALKDELHKYKPQIWEIMKAVQEQ
jgi:cell division protein FtsB